MSQGPLDTTVSFVYAANNRNGVLCGEVIRALGYCPSVLLLHPQSHRKHGEELCALFPQATVVEWGTEVEDRLREIQADMLLSVNFGYIFKKSILSLFRYPVNLHMGYLPYNRGAHPNVWAIYEETPAGVTLHVMSPGIDEGDIIAQSEVPVEPTETGKSLYGKLERASAGLLKEWLPTLMTGCFPKHPMPRGGSYHRAEEFAALCAIDPETPTTAKDLIRRLRALEFPPYRNAYLDQMEEPLFLNVAVRCSEARMQSFDPSSGFA